MEKSCGKSELQFNKGERGSSRLKFIIIMSVVVIAAYVGYQYVPVRFQAERYKDFMQETVNKGAAMSRPSENIKEQLVKTASEYGVPANAVVTIEEQEGILHARVQYKRPIPLVAFTYEYEFDETVKSSSMWSVK
jgi:hypothetical protein